MARWLPDNRKVVAVDLDDVLADFCSGFLHIAKDLFGIDPTVRPTNWEMSNVLTAEQVDATWDELIHRRPNFWMSLEPVAGANGFLLEQLDIYTKLFFPTARANNIGSSVEYQSQMWLSEEFDIEFPQVFVADHKDALAKALKYDYFIDDRPKNCIEVKQARPECKVFVKTAMHNTDFNSFANGIERVQDFDTFAHLVLSEIDQPCLKPKRS